jgi:predicted dehydrogenase
VTTDKINIAIIGCGANAEINHLPALHCVPNLNLKALIDLQKERATRLAIRNGLQNIIIATDYRSILDLVDAVMVLTPPSARVKIISDCAKAGKHIFCEKPIARTVAEAQAIVSVVKEAGVKFLPGFNFRFSSHFRKMKELLDKGFLGTPWGFSASFFVNIENWPTISGFQFKKGEGGALFDTGMHMIDLVRWFFGEPKEIMGTLMSRSPKREVDDTVVVHLIFENNVAGTIYLTWYGPTPTQSIMIAGRRGVAEVKVEENAIFYKKYGWIAKAPAIILVRDPLSTYAQELRHFTEVVLKNKPPLVTIEDGVRALEIFSSIYEKNTISLLRGA